MVFARPCTTWLACAAAIFSITSARAETADPASLRARIETLGQLNGIALACGQPALSRRLKEIIIEEAPKERGVGEWFEQATHQSFLDQGTRKQSCPDSRTLAADVDAAAKALRAILASETR